MANRRSSATDDTRALGIDSFVRPARSEKTTGDGSCMLSEFIVATATCLPSGETPVHITASGTGIRRRVFPVAASMTTATLSAPPAITDLPSAAKSSVSGDIRKSALRAIRLPSVENRHASRPQLSRSRCRLPRECDRAREHPAARISVT
jgi:hypothetical protein